MPNVEVAAPPMSNSPVLPLGLGQIAGGEADQHDADRDVDEEAPTPGDPGGQHAAEDSPMLPPALATAQ